MMEWKKRKTELVFQLSLDAILGPFGSGKTITGQKILENALPTLDPLKDVVCYVVFDQYSLLQVESEVRNLLRTCSDSSTILLGVFPTYDRSPNDCFFFTIHYLLCQ